MTLMIIGLVFFLGIHLVPAAPRLRAVIAGRLGEGPYKGKHDVIAVVAGVALAWLTLRLHPAVFGTGPVA